MGAFICSSPTRRMTRSKCVCPAVTLSVVAVTLLLNLFALLGPFFHTPTVSNRLEALSTSRLILKELPNTFYMVQRSAALRLLAHDDINNEVDFTDAQYKETVEEEYGRIISSQRWLRQRVDWEERDLEKAPDEPDNSQHLTVTIFSAPRAFTGNESEIYRQALLSWLHLSPRPRIVLLGNHSSLHKVADDFPGLVSVEANIDYSFTGLPMFNSMVARANAAETNVTVLIQPNVILLQDFMPGLRRLAATFNDWALVSQRLEVTELPFKFVHKGGGIVFLEHSVSGESMIDREMASYVRSSGQLELHEGVSIWAWNVETDGPLFAPPMPSFTYGAGYHDQWMARGFAKGSRAVVDATDALIGFHVLQARPAALTDRTTINFWNLAAKEWENIANLLSYRKHRDIWAEEKQLLSGGWKLISCAEPAMIKLCVSETQRATIPCRCGTAVPQPIFGTLYAETFFEKEARLRLEVIPSPDLGTGPEFSHDLDQLLPKMADAKRNVVVVGVTSAFRDMLSSFMCRARSLRVNNVLVAAFDKSVYRYAFVRGFPVFYAALSQKHAKRIEAAIETCDTGSTCFQPKTNLKPQVVSQILQRGYNVLWSDVDVVWFKNPLSYLTAISSGGLLVISDEPNMNLPANGPGRVNPGFFYARAEKLIIKTFKEIARHIGNSNPEQPFFNQVLCGDQGQRRVNVTTCMTRNGLRTTFLDRHTFSNGIVNGYWWHPNVTQVCMASGVYVLHNNWINGMENKVKRQRANQVWYFNDVENVCAHPWQHALGYRNNSQLTELSDPRDLD